MYCVHESRFIETKDVLIEEVGRIPFDLKLTWGGRHVGYLHGDIVSIF